MNRVVPVALVTGPAFDPLYEHLQGFAEATGVEVDLSWADGRATAAELRPDVSGEHKVRPTRGQRVSNVTEGRRRLKLTSNAEGVVLLRLAAGARYLVRFI